MKQIIAFITILTMSISICIPTYAKNVPTVNSNNYVVKNTFDESLFNLETVKEIIFNSNDNIEILVDNENTLEFSRNGTITTISFSLKDNVKTLVITEDTLKNVLELNTDNSVIYVDGCEISYSETHEISTVSDISPYASWGSPFDIKKGKVSFEEKTLIQLTRTALAMLLTLYSEIPNILIDTVAGDIIDKGLTLGYLDCEAVYYKSYKQLNSNNVEYRNAWEMYWDSSYKDYLKTYYQTVISGNRIIDEVI